MRAEAVSPGRRPGLEEGAVGTGPVLGREACRVSAQEAAGMKGGRVGPERPWIAS